MPAPRPVTDLAVAGAQRPADGDPGATARDRGGIAGRDTALDTVLFVLALNPSGLEILHIIELVNELIVSTEVARELGRHLRAPEQQRTYIYRLLKSAQAKKLVLIKGKRRQIAVWQIVSNARLHF